MVDGPQCWSDEEAGGRARLIDAMLERGGLRLGFPDALEEQFERKTGPDRCRGFRRYGLIVFVLCNIFILNYFRLTPDVAWRELLVQVVLMTPLAAAVWSYMRTEPPVFRREMTQSCVALIGLVAPMIAYQGSGSASAIYFRYAPVLTLLYVNVVAAIRFRFALPASIVTVLCNVVDLALLGGFSSDVKGLVASSVLTTCGFTLLANHRLEREQRRTYLLNEREGLQRDEIIRLAARQAGEAARSAAEQDRAATAIAAHAAELRDAHRVARVGTWRRDLIGGTFSMSDELHQLLGTDPSTIEPTADSLLGLVHPGDLAETASALSRAMGGEDAVEHEWRMMLPDGRLAWFWSEMHPETDAAGRTVAIRGVCKDVTEHRAAAERIHRLAYHDPLTGLANRALLRERMTDAIARAGCGGDRVTVLCLDLDGFKAVNDMHGHGAGDRLLCEAAARLCRSVREGDLVARLGGDEFVVLQTEDGGPGMACATAERMVEVLREPYDLGLGQHREFGDGFRRHRAVPDRWRGTGDPAAQRRYRALPGEVCRQEPVRPLPSGDGRRAAPAPGAGTRRAPGRRTRGVRAGMATVVRSR